MMRQCCRLVLICILLTLCSCAAVLQAKHARISESFEKSTKDFNKMVRFREIESAGMTYLDPEMRDAFLKSAEGLKKREVTITDFRILASECSPEKSSGELVVEYDYYALPSNRIKTLTYRQKWVYLDTEDKRGWQLKSGLPAFD